jgi:DNA-binding NtrC family response regulator
MEQAKILVVDQEEKAYEPLKPGLAKHGYDLHTVSSVSQALNLAGVHPYQAALVAYPLTHETSLVPALHVEIPHLPVILVFPHPVASLHPLAIERVDNTISKPLTLEPVRLMLDRTLELALLRAHLRERRQQDCRTLNFAQQREPDERRWSTDADSFDETLAEKLRAIVPNMKILGGGALHRAVLSHVEKLLLTVVLTECRGNQVKSAEILGINRNTLRKKLRDLDLSIPR